MGNKRGWHSKKRQSPNSRRKARIDQNIEDLFQTGGDWSWVTGLSLSDSITEISKLDELYELLRPGLKKHQADGATDAKFGIPNLESPDLQIPKLVSLANNYVAVVWSLRPTTIEHLEMHFAGGGSTRTISHELANQMISDAITCYSEIEGVEPETKDLIDLALPYLNESHASITVAHLIAVLEREASDLLQDLGSPVRDQIEMITRIKALYPELNPPSFDDSDLARLARFYFIALSINKVYQGNASIGNRKISKNKLEQHICRNRIAHRIGSDQLDYPASAIIFSLLVSVVKERKAEETLSKIKTIRTTAMTR